MAKFRRSQRLQVFKELFDNKELLNLTLVTEDGGEIEVHLEMLVAKSRYFNNLITGTRLFTDGNITIPGISKEILTDVIHYIYTGELCIKKEKIRDLIEAGKRFSLPNIINHCKQYLVSIIDEHSCINLYNFGNFHQSKDLKDEAMSFILKNFEKIYKKNPDFLDLHVDDLMSILSSDLLDVSHEFSVYDALVKWVSTEPTARSSHMSKLLLCLRVGLCDSTFLHDHMWCNPLITRNEDCHGLLYQASELFSEIYKETEQRGEMYNDTRLIYDAKHPFLRPRVPKEIIFVMGGWSAGSATNIMETYDFQTQRWFLTLDSDTIPRAYHGMVWHLGRIYVIGGFDGNQCFSSVRCFDPVTHTWEEKGCMNVQRCYVSVTTVADNIYAMGGFDGHSRSRTCEKYDVNQNQWSLVANMLNIRSDASADSLEGKIYIAGGFNGTQVLESAECYNPETDQWTLISNMLSRRSGVKVVAFRNHIYAIGGFNGSNRLATVERYDPITRQWNEVEPMLGPRSNFATAIVNDRLYAIGGFNGLSTIFTTELYDPSANVWKHAPDLNLNRSALAACKVNGIATAQDYSFLGISG